MRKTGLKYQNWTDGSILLTSCKHDIFILPQQVFIIQIRVRINFGSFSVFVNAAKYAFNISLFLGPTLHLKYATASGFKIIFGSFYVINFDKRVK